jgi:hypothetical protein
MKVDDNPFAQTILFRFNENWQYSKVAKMKSTFSRSEARHKDVLGATVEAQVEWVASALYSLKSKL